MIMHTEPSLRIYFGDAKNQLYPHEYLQWHDNLLAREQFASLTFLKLNQLVFLHQVHGVVGEIITQDPITPFSLPGDFLITRESHYGLGVMTADCVPLVLYDKKNHAVGIVHAGWRGAVKGVVLEAIKRMQQQYSTQFCDIKIFLGPSAKKCCYEVDDRFSENLEHYFFGPNYVHKKTNGQFFDLPGFLIEQLSEFGIEKKVINLDYNSCTICDTIFWSYRRGTKIGAPENVGRQMTVVSLA